MENNLEKIEQIKDRTGATYAEAKEALELADGSVVDAIIALEDKLNQEYEDVAGISLKDSPVFAKMKEIVEKGNVSKIIVRKNDNTIVNFPVTVGVIGAVLVPWGAILGIAAALGTQCEFRFEKEDGTVVDINGKVVGAYDRAKDAAVETAKKGASFAQGALGKAGIDADKVEKAGSKIEEFANKTSDKLQEFGDKGSAKVEAAWDKLEENGTVDEIKEAFVSGTARIMKLWDKIEGSGKIDEIKEAAEKVAKKAADTAKNIAKEATDRAAQSDEEFAADVEKTVEEEFENEEI
jgi:hypothetical protein